LRRFWILLCTELKAWRSEPISAVGGLLPPLILLVAFGLIFGGRLTMKTAFIDNDEGPKGAQLKGIMAEELSPFDQPYYDLVDADEATAFRLFNENRIDGIWIIPTDFSKKVEEGKHPSIDMHLSNYNDDKAKNHRIYASEILWKFYKELGMPPPPLDRMESYPGTKMIGWFPLIAVGVMLLSAMLGSMFNILLLNHRQLSSKITLELSLAPKSSIYALAAKTVLALFMGLFLGTIILIVLYFWLGCWPGKNIWAVWLICGLVSLFWINISMYASFLFKKYITGGITTVLGGILIFFLCGGFKSVRDQVADIPFFAWIFPNTYAVDPLRDIILTGKLSNDLPLTIGILVLFASASLGIGFFATIRRLRILG